MNIWEKIKNYTVRIIDHSVFALTGWYLFSPKIWFHTISMMDEHIFEWPVYIYYYCYYVRYTYHLYATKHTDKDFWLMLLHHVMTLVLLWSSSYRFTRIGIIIAVNHDYADIFLNLAKLCNLMKYKFTSAISLAIFVYVWIKTRIILNYNILEYIFFVRQDNNYQIDEKIAITLLVINFMIQSFWQVLIIKFIYNIIIDVPSIDEKGNKYKII